MARNLFIRILPVLVFSVLVNVAGVFGQAGGTGAITGVVSDATGAVVNGATVALTSKATNQTQTKTTGDDGLYNFLLLQPGNYTVKTSAPSFGDSSLDVEVQVGRTTDANVTLTAGGVAATVQVTAEGIQTTVPNFDAVQNDAAIQNLPINGRRFQDFVTLTPTAQVDPSRGQISLSGQRGINTNVSVDGVDYNQPFFGGIRGGERSNSAFTLPQEAIREFQVVAAGYSAEFGRSSGGVVNVSTRSGSNDFRGSLFILYRPEDLALGNEFTDALREQKLRPLDIPLIIAPTLRQMGGRIGGPLKKDKLFFFGAYEQQNLSLRRAVAYTNLPDTFMPTEVQAEPAAAYRSTQGPYSQTNDAKSGLIKIDWNVNDSNRFNIRYNQSKNNALNAVSTGESVLDPTTFRSLGTNGTEIDRTKIVVGQLVSNLTTSLFNELRFQWAKEERPRLANSQQVSVITSIGELGTRNFLPTTQDDTRKQIMDSIGYARGSHSFKFGGEFSKIDIAQVFGFNQFGSYTFSGLTNTGDILNALSAIPDTPAGKLGRFDVSQARFNQQIGNLQAAFDIKQLAFYGTDTWRVTPRFSLTYGVRFEKQLNPSAEANNSQVITAVREASFPLLGGHGLDPASIPDSKNEWEPRLGFSFDVKGDGRTVLRAFSGIYHATTPAIVLAAPFNNFRTPAGDLTVQLGPGAFNANTFDQVAFDAANPQYVAIVGPNMAPNTVYRQLAILGLNLNNFALNNLPTLSPAQLQDIADSIQAARSGPPSLFGVFQQANFIGISPDFENPESYVFGGGVEHEWRRDIIIGADFSWVKTVHLERNVDINLPAPSSFDPATGRPIYVRNNRPIPQLGSIQLRDSSANSLFRSVTGRLRINKHWGQINAYYTWSKNESDDDNERDSGGVLYDDPFTRRGEYYASRLDRTHQFVASPVLFLPYGIEFSSNIRLRSGNPINPVVGTDLNGDNNSGNERPYLVPNVEFPRNYFRNNPIYDVDVRAQKRFRFDEHRSLVLSGEIFNVLNLTNMQFAQTTAGGSPSLYCAGGTLSRCGLDGVTNPNFLQIRERRPGNPNFGKINLLNSPGSQPFQVQIGARFYF